MRNDDKPDIYGRILKLFTKVSMLVMDGKRSPERVADALQKILDQMVPQDKFFPPEPFGAITVPPKYSQAKWLKQFKEHWSKYGITVDPIYEAEKISAPEHVLRPGERLLCQFFCPKPGMQWTYEEGVQLLSEQPGAVFPGIEGVCLAKTEFPMFFPLSSYCFCPQKNPQEVKVADERRFPCLSSNDRGDKKLTFLPSDGKLLQRAVLVSFTRTV